MIEGHESSTAPAESLSSTTSLQQAVQVVCSPGCCVVWSLGGSSVQDVALLVPASLAACWSACRGAWCCGYGAVAGETLKNLGLQRTGCFALPRLQQCFCMVGVEWYSHVQAGRSFDCVWNSLTTAGGSSAAYSSSFSHLDSLEVLTAGECQALVCTGRQGQWSGTAAAGCLYGCLVQALLRGGSHKAHPALFATTTLSPVLL
jgi:hypothetical protein